MSTTQLPVLKYEKILDQAWADMKGQLPIMAGLSFLLIMAMIVSSRIIFANFFFNAVFAAGYVVCLVRLRDQKDMGFSDFFWAFSDLHRLAQLVVLVLVQSLLLAAGFFLLIIPGIYLAVALIFSQFYFVTREQDGIAAIKASLNLVNGQWWSVFGLLMILCILNGAGLLFFGVGVLITMPLSTFSLLRAMEALSQNKTTTQEPPLFSAPQENSKSNSTVDTTNL